MRWEFLADYFACQVSVELVARWRFPPGLKYERFPESGARVGARSFKRRFLCGWQSERTFIRVAGRGARAIDKLLRSAVVVLNGRTAVGRE
jgi:hypothetical protein